MSAQSVKSAPSFVGVRTVRVVCAILALAVSGCGPGIDVKQVIQIMVVSGGWYDAGLKDGKNKLTPSVTFRVKKSIDDPVSPLALNLAFKKITPKGEEDFDDFYVQSVTFAEGNQSAPLTVRTETGYTADPPQSRLQMLQHEQFQDLRVVFFAKHSSSNWVELARYDIPRKLITR
jgi:hypothetical protein